MILKVNKDICEIKQNEVWNVGDYNVHTVQVELSEEFDGLVNKVRYFVEDNSYDMLINDNVAQVPYEATVMEGTIKIGVYGYDADTDILVQSTSPVNKYITSGTYTGDPDNTQPLTPTDKEQMETAIQKNTNDITDLKANKQDKLISGVNIKTINNESILSSGNLTLVTEETDPIFTTSPAYSITDNDITYWNNKANMSDIPDVSNFITKDVDNLTYYTKSTDMQTAINNAVGNERTARENADNSLQNQIDAITVSSDVVDVVSTYQDLVDYDTQHIKANDIIKVMQDSTHDNAISYYRWVIVNHVGSWEYVGSEGPYYIKSETDTLLNAKQNTLVSGQNIKTINNESLLGEGNINIQSGGTSDYTDLTNKPKINNVELNGNKSLNDLGIQPVGNYALESDMTEAQNDIDHLSKVSNLFGKITGTGTSVTLNDTSNTIMKLNLDARTEQVTTTGKNKWSLNSSYTTETGNEYVLRDTTIQTIPAGTYTLSLKKSVNNNVLFTFKGDEGYQKTVNLNNVTSNTAEFTSDVNKAAIYIYGSEATTISEIMVSTSGGDYEPYTGGQPAPSPSYPQTIHTINGNNDIKINNKNLLKITTFSDDTTTKTTNGITATIKDGKIHISGTSSARTTFTLKKNDFTVSNEFYYYCNSINSVTRLEMQCKVDGATKYLNSYSTANFQNATTSFEYTSLYVVVENGQTVNHTFTPMIVEGSTLSQYEPYKQQTYSVNLGVENIITTYKSSGSGFINWNYDNSKMKKQMTYSFKADFSTTNATIYMRATDGSSAINLGVIPTITSGTVSSLTFTLTDEQLNSIKSTTGGFIQVYRVGVSMSETSLTNVQLEEGTKVNSYSPYNQTPIELCKIGDYKDVLFKNTMDSDYYDSSLELNKWYKINNVGKVIYDGSQGWASGQNSKGVTYFYKTLTDKINGGTVFCNLFTQRSSLWTLDEYTDCIVTEANNKIVSIMLSDSTITTPQLFGTWLSTHNTIVYYPLATPTYTLLSNTLQTQLDSIQYALAYDDKTYILQTNTDLPFIIDAETYAKINAYLTDYVKNTDYATSNKGGVIKTGYGSNVDSNGNLYASNFSYANYQTAGNNNFISKGTLENVITGKGLVTNTDYASSSTGGVLKTDNVFGVGTSNSGNLYAQEVSYANYSNFSNYGFISKGTLENVLRGYGLIE